MSIALNVEATRSHFPSLSRVDRGRTPIYFDNPGGTQVAREVIDGVTDYYLRHNANHGGAFATSVRSDEILHEAHAAMADFLGAASPDEIVFGPNMTTLTFSISRAIGRTLEPGDEIVVTRLDHDANIAPWVALEERGVVVRWVDINPGDCTLDMGLVEATIDERTKVVAIGYASNAVGTINDVKTITEMAHAVGALVFVDAVQYAPHGPIDVADLGCDLLACSAYKFFGRMSAYSMASTTARSIANTRCARPATGRPTSSRRARKIMRCGNARSVEVLRGTGELKELAEE
jgi:cysteine desulfurase family protein (TIGR01976 family)